MGQVEGDHRGDPTVTIGDHTVIVVVVTEAGEVTLQAGKYQRGQLRKIARALCENKTDSLLSQGLSS